MHTGITEISAEPIRSRPDSLACELFKLCLVRSHSLGNEELRFGIGSDPLYGAPAGTGYPRDCFRGLP
jgi:hypothetical protein